MPTKLKPEDADKLRAISTALSDWRSHRWWLLGLGVVMIASAVAIVWSVFDVVEVVLDLDPPATFGDDFGREAANYLRALADNMRAQSNLFLVLTIRMIVSLVTGLFALVELTYVIRYWNGSPALRALEVIARRELEAADVL